MRRSQRIVHRMLWPVLAPAIALGVAFALGLRPAPAPVAQVEVMQ